MSPNMSDSPRKPALGLSHQEFDSSELALARRDSKHKHTVVSEARLSDTVQKHSQPLPLWHWLPLSGLPPRLACHVWTSRL